MDNKWQPTQMMPNTGRATDKRNGPMSSTTTVQELEVGARVRAGLNIWSSPYTYVPRGSLGTITGRPVSAIFQDAINVLWDDPQPGLVFSGNTSLLVDEEMRSVELMEHKTRSVGNRTIAASLFIAAVIYVSCALATVGAASFVATNLMDASLEMRWMGLL